MNRALILCMLIACGCATQPHPSEPASPRVPTRSEARNHCVRTEPWRRCFPQGASRLVIPATAHVRRANVVSLPRHTGLLTVSCSASSETNFAASVDTLLSCDADGRIEIYVTGRGGDPLRNSERPLAKPVSIDAGMLLVDGTPMTIVAPYQPRKRYTDTTGVLVDATPLTFPISPRRCLSSPCKGDSITDQEACLRETIPSGELGAFDRCGFAGWAVMELPQQPATEAVGLALEGGPPMMQRCDGELRQTPDGLAWCDGRLLIRWFTEREALLSVHAREVETTVQYGSGVAVFQSGGERREVQVAFELVRWPAPAVVVVRVVGVR